MVTMESKSLLGNPRVAALTIRLMLENSLHTHHASQMCENTDKHCVIIHSYSVHSNNILVGIEIVFKDFTSD